MSEIKFLNTSVWVWLDPRTSSINKDDMKSELMIRKLCVYEIGLFTKCRKAVLCDILGACTNVAVHCCVIL